MENFNLTFGMVAKLNPTDYVGFTFFVGCMAMMAAAAFFFLSLNQFDKKWRTSVLVSGLITFIAAVHYFYMRDYWAAHAESPTFFRYVDWILTVPLMCVEFYLILKVAGAKQSLLWKMIIFSVIMLVTGYFGEAVYKDQAAFLGIYLWSSVLLYCLRNMAWKCKETSSRSWWRCVKSTQNTMLVRSCGMGNLSNWLHDGNYRMVQQLYA